MNKPPLITALLRRFFLSMALFSGFQIAVAQTIAAPRFFVNFTEANPAEYQISFKSETDQSGNFDFVVFEAGNELFRFRKIKVSDETPYSIILVNDKNKALEGLKQKNTLTNYSNFGFEISAAFEDKDIAYIGILECTTKDGATSRMQVAKMVIEDEPISLSAKNR